MKKTLAVLLGVLLLVACKSHPVVLNIGSAGSAKYPIGTIVNCTKIFNGDGELVLDCIEFPGESASVFSGDFFMSTQTFSPEQVRKLSQQYDLFDMEAYAVAQFCKMYDIPFYCLKAVSDNYTLEGATDPLLNNSFYFSAHSNKMSGRRDRRHYLHIQFFVGHILSMIAYKLSEIRHLPVISCGCSSPRIWRMEGATSAREPS